MERGGHRSPKVADVTLTATTSPARRHMTHQKEKIAVAPRTAERIVNRCLGRRTRRPETRVSGDIEGGPLNPFSGIGRRYVIARRDMPYGPPF